MTGVALTVYCDNSAACYATVSVGAGWARVAVHAPPAIAGERLAAELPRAAAMLAAAGGLDQAHAGLEGRERAGHLPPSRHGPSGAPAVCISGPDAPPDPGPLRLEALRLWGIAALAPSGAPLALRLEDTIRQWGALEVRPCAYEASPLGALAHGSEALVAQMVGTVATHVSQYGSAPDFASARPSDRERAYNYIRSTTAKPQASGEVVEEVRRRLAGR